MPETIPATLQGSLNTKEAVTLSESDVRKQLDGIFLKAESQHPWLLSKKLVVKPDQLIKRRGKGGLLALNVTWQDVKLWISQRAGKEVEVMNQPKNNAFTCLFKLLLLFFRLIQFLVFYAILLSSPLSHIEMMKSFTFAFNVIENSMKFCFVVKVVSILGMLMKKRLG